MIGQLIEEATLSGSRLEAAVGAIGLSIRTFQRWNLQDAGSDRRRGPGTDPSNKLVPAERQNLLNIANSPEFRDLSPKQIVPQLADQGIYVASESSFYRVLRNEGHMAHREPSRPATSRKPKEHVATGPCQVWSWDITYRAPRPGIGRGRILGMHKRKEVLRMPCSSLWKSMSPSGGDLLLTGRVT